MTLAGKSVVVFGGSSGIGLATAELAAKQGAQVTLVARDPARLRAATERVGAGAQAIPADIGDEAQVVAVFARLGAVDHVVTTAADLAYAPVKEFALEAAQKVLASKVLGPLLVTKHAAPRLPPDGSVTYVSGVAAYKPMAGGAMVGAANAALEGLAMTAAIELAPVRVNAVSPGVVVTPSWNGMPPAERAAFFKDLGAKLPARRVGQPEDLAQAIVAVMTNGYITGTVLHVDGGHRLV